MSEEGDVFEDVEETAAAPAVVKKAKAAKAGTKVATVGGGVAKKKKTGTKKRNMKYYLFKMLRPVLGNKQQIRGSAVELLEHVLDELARIIARGSADCLELLTPGATTLTPKCIKAILLLLFPTVIPVLGQTTPENAQSYGREIWAECEQNMRKYEASFGRTYVPV